ncbi:MAG: quinohemoprotein amine dehydrogenase subunit gamma [Terriglobales bacterium]
MKHLKPLNKKARKIEAVQQQADSGSPAESKADLRALQAPQLPLGCALIFDPGWEADSSGQMTGLCQPMEADLYGCYDECWWPAQLPDQLTSFLEWSDKCASAERDWRKLDLVPTDK